MTELFTLHRGPRYDRKGNTIDGGDVQVRADGIAPGAASRWAESVRNGRSIAYTVFIKGDPVNEAGQPVTIAPADLVTIRGDRKLTILINDWRSPYTRRKGLEIIALGGVG